MDVIDVANQHRINTNKKTTPHVAQSTDQKNVMQTSSSALTNDSVYKELQRRFELHFIPRKKLREVTIPLRQVRSQHIGKLITVKGMVTRVSEVKPMVVVATYTCKSCSMDICQKVNSKQFMPLETCPSIECQRNRKTPGRLQLQTRGSKFVKFQEIRIQELADQVPIGHIPRTILVHFHGELTRQLSPGDIAIVDGIFLPVPNQGYRARVAGLVASTYILGLGVSQQKQKYDNFMPDEKAHEAIEELRQEKNSYGHLANSIAPEIYGHEDIKKALLLMMVGGVTRQMSDGMKIRGDINICLMGDPGVAKSQLLKHISTIAPRGVYTSGKGSSGVGLTAAVIRDNMSKELTLEGGSLVLADMGICCIDEFDKMDETDRTAIHEVMEQQTISIAKAGITTSLNARTSILAAANPLYGRYNIYKSPIENINLPAALLSRFDLLFILLDTPEVGRDRELAEHVCYVHRFNSHPPARFTGTTSKKAIPPEVIRSYIGFAKQFQPYVPHTLQSYIVDSYIQMRQSEYAGNHKDESENFGYTTARTLLAILRLSQAMARIRFDTEIKQQDVEEAIRLMRECRTSLRRQREERKMNRNQASDPVTEIFNIIRNIKLSNPTVVSVKYSEVVNQVLKKFSQNELENVLKEYERLGVWHIDAAKTTITFVD
eukprot:TRINITY_DN7254_c0_g1_i4.p1 TRINITY_DN7254_c0_g1~~TRINITY_DN7254_c0_g1_i4.p1  ORF type:complete len:661 (-),score=157.97 TRINITY_DN7254_c0_g1_i4:83-2065(-)